MCAFGDTTSQQHLSHPTPQTQTHPPPSIPDTPSQKYCTIKQIYHPHHQQIPVTTHTHHIPNTVLHSPHVTHTHHTLTTCVYSSHTTFTHTPTKYHAHSSNATHTLHIPHKLFTHHTQSPQPHTTHILHHIPYIVSTSNTHSPYATHSLHILYHTQ